MCVCVCVCVCEEAKVHQGMQEEEEEEKEEEECVPVVLAIQHEMRMRSIILSSVDCPDLPYIPHYLINDTILVKKSCWT